VSGLFDRFTHDIIFKPDEQITIMIGPNGFGKTMVLRIANALFNEPLRRLAGMPFNQVLVDFDNGSILRVERNQKEKSEEKSRTRLALAFKESLTSKEEIFLADRKINPRDLPYPTGVIEDYIPMLDQIGPSEWRNRRTGELLDLEDVLDRFADDLPRIESVEMPTTPDWLKAIRHAIPVRLIDTERLTHPHISHQGRLKSQYRARHSEHIMQRTVRRYSEELAERVQATLSEYGSQAQALDRTFPVRLVDEPPASDYRLDSLRAELDSVEKRRAQLVEAGLLAQELEGWEVPRLEDIDESRRGVLAVFARDARTKLSIFDDLYMRIDALKRISNTRFLHKNVSVGRDGLSIYTDEGSELELEMLSSGEQHELAILYELLFRVSDNSLILIDEPELSLHVAWQEKFLDDLDEMSKISKFRVLLATHSPQIICDRWDLTVELKGPNGQ